MTLLQSHQVASIPALLSSYDCQLQAKTGASLKQIACKAANISEEEFKIKMTDALVAIVPMNSGNGIIPGFAQALQSITVYLGANAFITLNHDVAGLAEAVEMGAEIVLVADDNRFVSIYLPAGQIIDNAEATAKGYLTALELIAQGLKEKEVLVIGAGCVGKHAVAGLVERGAKPVVYEIDTEIIRMLEQEGKVKVVRDLSCALHYYNIIFDASPAPDIIHCEHIKPKSYIAAPGIPLALSSEAVKLVKDRLVHDALELGVATMLTMTGSRIK